MTLREYEYVMLVCTTTTEGKGTFCRSGDGIALLLQLPSFSSAHEPKSQCECNDKPYDPSPNEALTKLPSCESILRSKVSVLEQITHRWLLRNGRDDGPRGVVEAGLDSRRSPHFKQTSCTLRPNFPARVRRGVSKFIDFERKIGVETARKKVGKTPASGGTFWQRSSYCDAHTVPDLNLRANHLAPLPGVFKLDTTGATPTLLFAILRLKVVGPPCQSLFGPKYL